MQPFVVAHKELVDHFRDRRSIALSAMYAVMGPAVMWLAFSRQRALDPSAGAVWPIMAAVFALMAAFTGSMAAAMDTIAGERERRSLVPLLVSATSRRDVIVGKWMALTVLSVASLLLSLLGFGLVFSQPGVPPPLVSWLLSAPAMIALGMLAAASELLVSTLCRSTKEANTYVSILVFAIMGVSMWIAFTPSAALGWPSVVPMLGHQRLLASAFAGGSPSIVQAGLMAFQSTVLAAATIAATAAGLAVASKLFERDEAAYGG